MLKILLDFILNLSVALMASFLGCLLAMGPIVLWSAYWPHKDKNGNKKTNYFSWEDNF